MQKKSNINSKGKGWFNQPSRHSLSARGIKTSNINEAQAKKIAKGIDEINPEEWEGEMKSEAGKVVAQNIAEAIEDDELKAEGKLTDVAKKIGGKAKEIGGKVKEKAGDMKDWVSDKVSSTKDQIEDKTDKKIGKTIKDDMQNQSKDVLSKLKKQSDDRVNSTASDTDKTDFKNMSAKEVADKVRKGGAIDAGAISLSTQNKQELAQLMSNLRHDVETMKNKLEIVDALKDEEVRYYTQEFNTKKDELKEEYDHLKNTIPDENELKKEKNELKNELEMSRLEYKMKVMDSKANYEYAKKMHEYMKDIYKQRKSFVEDLIA